MEVFSELNSAGFWAIYDDSGSVGRRYARSDEVGTPLAVVIDYNTVQNNVLTIRDRDSWEQVSLIADSLTQLLDDYFNHKLEFIDLGDLLVR
jgi:glycyl-tRNA synthetase